MPITIPAFYSFLEFGPFGFWLLDSFVSCESKTKAKVKGLNISTCLKSASQEPRGKIADDEAAVYCRDRLVEQLPEHWTACAHDYEELVKNVAGNLGNDAEMQNGLADFSGLWFWGAKDGSVHSGLETSGIGNLRLCDPCWHLGLKVAARQTTNHSTTDNATLVITVFHKRTIRSQLQVTVTVNFLWMILTLTLIRHCVNNQWFVGLEQPNEIQIQAILTYLPTNLLLV